MSDANLAEQAEELEVLASIYPEEFKSLGDGEFKILLKPNPDGTDNHGRAPRFTFTASFKQSTNTSIFFVMIPLYAVLQSSFPWFAKFHLRIRPTRLPVSR